MTVAPEVWAAAGKKENSMEKNKKVPVKLTILVLAFFALAGCNEGSGEVAADLENVVPEQDEIPEVPGEPSDCIGDTNPPIADSPYREIIDPNPPYTFSWINSGCEADTYILFIHLINSPSVALIEEEFDFPASQYSTNTPLEPVTTYSWRLGVQEDSVLWQISKHATFTTGPVCDTNALVAPILISPSDESIDQGIGWGPVHIVIAYPIKICTPDGFEIFVSTEEDFSGKDWYDHPIEPFYEIIKDGNGLLEGNSNSLKDCTTHYWRAWATVEDTDGPVSKTYSFYTDFEGTCKIFSEFEGIKDANCRSNPWINGNEVGALMMGETATLLGLNEDASWGKFELMNKKQCWVIMSAVEKQPSGSVLDPSKYQVLKYNPSPEAGPDVPLDAPIPAPSCSRISDSRTCESNSACSWNTNENVCKNK